MGMRNIIYPCHSFFWNFFEQLAFHKLKISSIRDFGLRANDGINHVCYPFGLNTNVDE
jgi:hypothetical protein